MNIFILDNDVKKCAEYHCATHTSKMVSEYAQLLSTAIEETTGIGIKVSDSDIQEFNALYPKLKTSTIKKTHVNHPCAKWVRESYANFEWLLSLLESLHDEWQYKFNHDKGEFHGSYYKFLSGYHEPNIKDIGLTPFPMAMPMEYRSSNVVDSYRLYYNKDKRHLFNWKNRNTPYWVNLSELDDILI